MLVWEALEERGVSMAVEQHEDVITVRLEVWRAPWLDDKAIGTVREGQGVAVRHGGVVDGEAAVGIVDVEDPVGARWHMEHQHAVDAEEEVAEACMAATWAEGEGVVHRNVAAVGPARADRDIGY